MPLINTIGTAAARSYGFLTQSGIGGSIIFYNSTTSDLTSNYINGINNDSSKNFYFDGSSSSHWLVFKSSASGTVNWQKEITSGYATSGRGSFLDSSGNLYALGTDTAQLVSGWGPANLYKFDSSGNLSFRKGALNNTASANPICDFSGGTVDSSGNIYCVGYVDIPYRYGFIIKYNSSGVLQWNEGRGNAVSGRSAQYSGCVTDSSGNIYIAGALSISATTTQKPAFLKYSSAGTLTFQKYLTDSVAQNYSFASIATDATNYFLAGVTYDGTRYETLIASYTSSGTLSWQKRIYSSNNVLVQNCKYINSYIYLVGYTQISGKNNTIVMKLDTSGNIIWQKMISAATYGMDGKNFYIDANYMVITSGIAGAAGAQKIVEITLPVSNGISGTFVANGYTFTCSDATLSIGTSTLTDATPTTNSSTSLITEQTTFGTINNSTLISSNVTAI